MINTSCLFITWIQASFFKVHAWKCYYSLVKMKSVIFFIFKRKHLTFYMCEIKNKIPERIENLMVIFLLKAVCSAIGHVTPKRVEVTKRL